MWLKGINYWSFPGGLDGKVDVFEAIRLAQTFGFEALELAVFESGGVQLDASEAQCREIRQHAEARGVRLDSLASGLYWGRSLGDSDPEKRRLAQSDLEAMIRITSWLEAKTLLTIPGSVDVFFMPDRQAQPYEEVWRNATEGMMAVLPLAEKHGVRLGIENVWNRFLLSPQEMAKFIDQFQSPWLGAYVDVANLLPFGYAENWLRELGRRVVGVHFKDYRRAVGTAEGFVDLLEGDVDWPEVVKALQEIDYRGPLVAEMIPSYKHFPMVRVANASRAMDAILGR